MTHTESYLQDVAVVLYQNVSLVHDTTAEIDECVSVLNALSVFPELPVFTLRLCKTLLAADHNGDTKSDSAPRRGIVTLLLSNPSRETLVAAGYNDIRDAFPSFCELAPFSTNAGCLTTLTDIQLLFGDRLGQDVLLRKTWRLLTATLRNAIERGGALAPAMERVLASLHSAR